MINEQRPAVLHAGTPAVRRPRPSGRVEWRRHLHEEPPGLLRKVHKQAPRMAAQGGAVSDA